MVKAQNPSQQKKWRPVPRVGRVPFCGLAAVLFALGCGPGSPVESARELLSVGRFTESLETLRPLVEERPDDGEVNYLYGLALVRSGQPGLAVWPLRRAVQSPEYDVPAGTLLASALLGEGNARDAEMAADRVVTLAPDNIEALGLRAQARVGLRQWEEALADMDRVLALNPEDYGILAIRAHALIGLERHDEADATLEEVSRRVAEQKEPPLELIARLCATRATFARERGDSERAEEAYAQCLEAHPGDVAVVGEAVEFFDERGDRARAMEILRRAVEASPRHVGLRLSLAERLRVTGEVEEAERLLVDATAEQPSPAAWMALMDHYVKRQEWAAAASAVQELMKAYRDPPPSLLFIYADILVEQGQLERARTLADSLENPMRDLLYGKMLLGQGDARAALDALERGIRLWPDNALARFLAGRAAEQLGDFDRAISEYRDSLGSDAALTEAGLNLARLHVRERQFPAARIAILHFLKGRPQDAEGLALAVQIAQRLGQPQEAMGYLRRLNRVPGQASRALAERARIRERVSGPEAAIEAIQASPLDLSDPGHAEALRALVRALVAAERAEEAMARVEAALERHPDAADFHELHGFALEATGHLEEAVRGAHERALSLEPEHASSLAALARITAASDFDAALALYDRAAAADPQGADHAWSAIALLLGSDDPVREPEVERRLEALLQLDPANGRAASELARLLAGRGEDLDRALSLARRAVRFGADSGAWETLGTVRFARGELEPAIEALERSLERRPDSPATRYKLGMALAAAGRVEDARAALRQALESGEFSEAEAARQELARLNDAVGMP